MTGGSDIPDIPDLPGVLVLAGLDPSGGAGLLADAEAIRAAGARPLCVATALTVQTTKRARRFETCGVQLIQDSVQALLEEENVKAIKIGMIGSAEIAQALEQLLPKDLPRVVDPVLRSTSGALLLRGPPEVYLRLALGALLTPNVPEARELGERLLERGPGAVLFKGGHRGGTLVVDKLVTKQGSEEDFSAERIEGRKRGTGCRLASFIAARLALNFQLREAVVEARAYVRSYLSAP
jgi:hydroxymethylpyrimidine/phosphomethylpyrimidine kinase